MYSGIRIGSAKNGFSIDCWSEDGETNNVFVFTTKKDLFDFLDNTIGEVNAAYAS